MSLNIVSFKAPKFKPMPGELTPAVINGATLPVKIGIAQRAIAACCDLSELLTWKDKLAALAAAAKMARMPEMARDVNRVHKEAIFRMGEILLQYSSVVVQKGVKVCKDGRRRGGGFAKSERQKMAESVGIDVNVRLASTRLARAPADIRRSIIEDESLSPRPTLMAERAPRTKPATRSYGSDAARILLSGRPAGGNGHSAGLILASAVLRRTDVSTITQLAPEEKQRVRKLVVEMQEILDDIDRRLGPDTSVKS